MPDVSLGPVLVIASASVFGPLSGWLAGQRRRNVVIWGLFGVVLGPIASALLIGAPPGRCAACDWPVAGWGARCAACGASVRTGLAHAGDVEPAPAAPVAVAPALQAAAPAPAATTRARRRRSDATPTPAPRPQVEARSELSARGEPAWAPRVSATRLGHRPEDVGPAHPAVSPPSDAVSTPLAVLGSGVYIGGNRPIQVGNRYLLARVASELQILGPVHLDPGAIADRVPLPSIEAFRLEDRLVIDGRDGTTDISMAFVAVSEGRGVDIVAELAPPASAASQT